MNTEIVMNRWTVCFFIEAVALVAVLMHESHCKARRRERRCRDCQSEEVDRFHEMQERSDIGYGCYMTRTWSLCRDCKHIRTDKTWHPKYFSLIDLLWRRTAYKQQFKTSAGVRQEHLIYREGDFGNKFMIGDYFNHPKKESTTAN